MEYDVVRSYWLTLFNVETWEEFLAHGSRVAGFGEKSWKTLQRIKPGDYLLCYVTGAQRWTGVLEVTGPAFRSTERIWAANTYPNRLPVRDMALIEQVEYGVPVLDMRDQLTVFDKLQNPNIWSGRFRRSPARWNERDGQAVLDAVRTAIAHPVQRPLEKKRLRAPHTPQSRVIETDDATMTIPDDRTLEPEPSTGIHTEIQYLLLNLGAAMGFDVHVARNDLSRTCYGQRFADMPRRRDTLPDQFDNDTAKIIKVIDVLWLERNAVKAAFEVESTTAIYSGLLRMTDLLALQPNLSIPLFLVSHDEWREKVIDQINRPTFRRLEPPLNEVCRFISFEHLREEITRLGDSIRHMRFDWLQDLSESCQPTP